jgi:Tfp pilus assembly protein PilX
MRISEQRKKQNGTSLIAAVFIIVILAFMGVMFASLIGTSSFTAVNDLQSAQALYVAEGGLENAGLLLNAPDLTNRTSCGNLAAALNAKALGAGRFTVTVDAGSPFSPANAVTLAGLGIIGTTVNVSADPASAGYAPSGRIMIDRELIDYSGLSGNSFTGVVRGADGTSLAAHANGTAVGQYQCTVNSTGGVPDLAAPGAERQVAEGVQLQEGWTGGGGAGLPSDNLNSVSCVDSSHCWAVGDNGTILRWNGASWTQDSSPTGQNLRAVSMVSSSYGWAVGIKSGNQPTMLVWNGSSWTDQTGSAPATKQDLNSVSMVSAVYGWAVGSKSGNQPTMLVWDGSSWTDQTGSAPPTKQNLFSVAMVSPTGGWAGGAKSGNQPTMLVWDGSSWTDQTGSAPTINQNLNSVSMVSSVYGWAVGSKSGSQPTMLVWNGTSWTDQTASAPTINQNLNSVSMLSASDGWAVGDNGTILHWDGVAWSEWQQANATLLRWQQTAWTDATGMLPSDVAGLNAISTLSYADVWAVGNKLSNGSTAPCTAGMAGIVHWDGSSWSCVASPSNQNLNSLSMVSSVAGWAVGNAGGGGAGLCANARILQWDGAVWNCAASPSNQNLNAVFMVSTTDGWAVGNRGGGGAGLCTNGRILQWNGSAWNCVSSPVNVNLKSVSMLDTNNDGAADDGWAVGDRRGCVNPGPTIIEWSAGAWACPGTLPATADYNLNGVAMVSSSDGWAVGDSNGTRPVCLRWDTPCGGGALTGQWNDCTNATYVPAIDQGLTSVFCVNAKDCWAAGAGGLLLHWDGASWTQVASGTNRPLNTVSVLGPKQRPQAAWQEVVN